MERRLRIAIDCRIANPKQGVGTAVLAFAKALSDTQPTDQEYTFLVRDGLQDWLSPYVYGNCSLALLPPSQLSRWKDALRWIKPLRALWSRLLGRIAHVPKSDGFLESQDFDMVHFPTQTAYLTDVPSIYQPWDLQHCHYPEFFEEAELAMRRRCYPAFCDRAKIVCVQAEWTKKDLIRHYAIAAEKIAVIPWGSVFDAYSQPSKQRIQAVRGEKSLPNQFFFYPAATWPHKNHCVILRALAVLAAIHGLAPQVYFTGMSTEDRPSLDRLAEELGVSGQIHFLGFLSPEELQGVFASATAMIFPSKFEGFGLPILEAFQSRLPVICSNATTLPEVAQDAALYFDADSPEQLAAHMKTILDDPQVRDHLSANGSRILSEYSMNDTVARFQDLYRRVHEMSLRDGRTNPLEASS